jgi:hypothetical protein
MITHFTLAIIDVLIAAIPDVNIRAFSPFSSEAIFFDKNS